MFTLRLEADSELEFESILQSASQSIEPFVNRAGLRGASVFRAVAFGDDHGQLQQSLAAITKAWQVGTRTTALPRERAMLWDAGQNRHRVGWVFPGQGSQYPAVPQVISQDPMAAEYLQQLDRCLKQRGHSAVTPDLSDPDKRLGRDVWWTQQWVLAVSATLADSLHRRGHAPDVVLGHSFGECGAALHCGVMSLAQAIRFAKLRSDAVVMTVRNSGQLLSVRAEPSQVHGVLSRHQLDCYITHQNSPNQTVIAGDHESIETAKRYLAEDGYASVVIPVPAAFHTPLMADAQRVLASGFGHETLRPPRHAFLSATSTTYLAEPHAIRTALIEQLTHPVLYATSVRRMVDDGCGLLIEVGPSDVLTRLNQATVAGDALCVSLDSNLGTHAERLHWIDLAAECVTGKPLAQLAPTSVAQPSITRSEARPVASVTSEVEVFDVTSRARRSATSATVTQAHETPSSRSSIPTQPSQVESLVSHDVAKQFLVDIVVELTGYEPDVIDFDADLEAELGVDSIKKAQVIGELAEWASLELDLREMKLADYNTLGDILSLLGRAETNTSTGTPVPPVRRETVSATTTSPPHAAAPARLAESIEALMVDFVVDQTGYDPDVIDLDADLESELGIDSIKKAQLLGELAEQYELRNVELGRLSLADFVNLRSILDFVLEHSDTSDEPDELVPAMSAAEFNHVNSDDDDSDEFARGQRIGSLKKNEIRNRLRDRVEGAAEVNDVWMRELLFERSHRHHNSTSNVDAVTGTGPSDRLIAGLACGAGVHPASLTSSPSPSLSSPNSVSADSALCNTPVTVRESCSPRPASGRGAGGEGLGASDDSRRLLHGPMQFPPSPPPPLPHETRGRGEEIHHSQDVYNNDVDSGSREREGRPLGLGVVDLVKDPDTRGSLTRSTTAPSTRTVLRKPTREVPSQGTCRFTLHVVPRNRREGTPTLPTFHGDAIIVGDNPIAAALVQRLQELGVKTHAIAIVADAADADAKLAEIWSKNETPHLFLTTPHDRDSLRHLDAAAWQSRRGEALSGVFRVCQQWMQRMIDGEVMNRATLVTSTHGGGKLGLDDSRIESPESGGLAGLTKAMLIESWMRGFRETPMKVIEVGQHATPQSYVDGVLRELAVPSYDEETIVDGQSRWTIRARYSPLDKHDSATSKITLGGTWIVSGGGRGITAMTAMALAERHDLTLVLLGTAPVPRLQPEMLQRGIDNRSQLRRDVMLAAQAAGQNPIEAWRDTEKALEIEITLAECCRRGIAATYHSIDVADAPAVKRLIGEIRRQHGPIRGVIHGAGAGQDARFDRKRPDKVEKCIRAKVDGWIALATATIDDPLEWFVGFGSISGRFGANGHTDYSLANDMLAKCINRLSRDRPHVRCVTFHWHAWGDVGMAAKPEAKLALEMIGMQFMPAADGLAHFLNELEHGGDTPEVLITDRTHVRKFFSDIETVDGESACPSAPLLDPCGRSLTTQKSSYVVTLDPLTDRFLAEHRVGNRPTLPFVIALEMMAEAARAASGDAFVTQCISARAIQAIKFASDDAMAVEVSREGGTHSRENCWSLRADLRRKDGRLVEEGRQYFTASFVTAATRVVPKVELPAGRSWAFRSIDYQPASALVYHGDPLQALRQIAVVSGEALGRIAAPSPALLGGENRPLAGWVLPCAAMDAVLYAAAVLAYHEAGKPSLPVSFDEIRIGRFPDPGEPLWTHIRAGESDNQGMTLAADLVGQNGDLVLSLLGYRVNWIR